MSILKPNWAHTVSVSWLWIITTLSVVLWDLGLTAWDLISFFLFHKNKQTKIKKNWDWNWVTFSSCFTSIKWWRFKDLYPFCTVSVPFSTSWQYFHQHISLKVLWVILRILLWFSPLDKSTTLWGCCETMYLRFLEALLFSRENLWIISLWSLGGPLSEKLYESQTYIFLRA